MGCGGPAREIDFPGTDEFELLGSIFFETAREFRVIDALLLFEPDLCPQATRSLDATAKVAVLGRPAMNRFAVELGLIEVLKAANETVFSIVKHNALVVRSSITTHLIFICLR